jgi:hypothetical protein
MIVLLVWPMSSSERSRVLMLALPFLALFGPVVSLVLGARARRQAIVAVYARLNELGF